MKKFGFLFAGLLFAVSSSLFAGDSKKKEDYAINTAKSTVKWTAKSAKGGHFGKVQVASGTFQYDGKSIASGTVVINMTSISVDDIEDANRKQRLANHLKNDDFFSADKFPESKLVITGSKPGKTAGQLEVTGDLTIKGITKPVTFPVAVKGQGGNVEANGKITVDRIQYDIKFRSKHVLDPSALADRLIEDEFTLDFNVVASK
jgi:polyisoprenoid-binding protein YceI